MSHKRKKQKSDWINCALCKTTFSFKDAHMHSTICNDESAFGPFTITRSDIISHGYAVCDILVAKAVDSPGTTNPQTDC